MQKLDAYLLFPQFRLRLLRLMSRNVFATVAFVVFLAIVLASGVIETDGENLPFLEPFRSSFSHSGD